MSEIKKKTIEIDAMLPLSIKQQKIYTWTNDMIRNGIYINYVKYLYTKDGVDYYEVEYFEE